MSLLVHGIYFILRFFQSYQSKQTFQGASSQGTLDEIEEEQETEVGFILLYPFLSTVHSCAFQANEHMLSSVHTCFFYINSHTAPNPLSRFSTPTPHLLPCKVVHTPKTTSCFFVIRSSNGIYLSCQNLQETSDCTPLNGQRKGKKKKGGTSVWPHMYYVLIEFAVISSCSVHKFTCFIPVLISFKLVIRWKDGAFVCETSYTLDCFPNYTHFYPLQSKTSTPVQDLPPPPAMTEGDDDDYYDSGSQQVRNESFDVLWR